jgi:SAM-dependent methyltransferase
MSELKKLNLGCGADKKVGYVNIDWNDFVKPDVMYNLNEVPYPFADSTFDLIEAFHVLEHLDRPFIIMKELHRILKPGGQLIIKVPHFSRGLSHAEHTHGFDVTFPMFFNRELTKAAFSGYFGVDYRLLDLRMKWLAFLYILPSLGYGKTIIKVLDVVNRFISFLANLHPQFCSRIWCFWVGGFEEIEFQFECVKDFSGKSVK